MSANAFIRPALSVPILTVPILRRPFNLCPFNLCSFYMCPFYMCPFYMCPFCMCPFYMCPIYMFPFYMCLFYLFPFYRCPLYLCPSARPEVRGTADGEWRSLSAIPSAPSSALTTFHHSGQWTDGRGRIGRVTERGSCLPTIITQFVAMGCCMSRTPYDQLIRLPA